MSKTNLRRIVSIDSRGKKCRGGSCPSLYVGNEGNYYIQGYKVKAETRNSIAIPKEEDIVAIPRELIDYIKGEL